MARVMLVGATSAIAREVARICARRGDCLYLLARDAPALSLLAQELRGIASSDDRVAGFASGNFDDCESNAALIEEGLVALGGLDTAIIAHGLLGDQPASEREYAEARGILSTNLTSVISLLIPIANALEAQGHGSVAVMSSVAAERGRPRNFTYGAAKAGVNTYLEGLRSRLWRCGARVHLLRLGPVDTPMTVDHEKNASFAQPQDVADRMLQAIEHGRAEVYVPGYWRPVMFAVRWMPEWLFQRLRFLSGR
jgi:decaprenylphospho-beta-D-erythro-pentofuranosid-2-ulose 2-reductase